MQTSGPGERAQAINDPTGWNSGWVQGSEDSQSSLGELQPQGKVGPAEAHLAAERAGSGPGSPQTCMNHHGQPRAVCPGRAVLRGPQLPLGAGAKQAESVEKDCGGVHPGTLLCSLLPQIGPWPPASPVGFGALV